MSYLIIIRHGQSEWNLENRFTGWADVGLTLKGEEEARVAGQAMKDFPVDQGFTSVLKRAIHTLEIVLDEIHKPDLPVMRSQALNERNYGDLQGLNKADTARKYGEEQVHIWRRSYDVRPPGGESLEDTYNRVIPYYLATIKPFLENQKNCLVVAHGNSLRALIMYLEKISPKGISELNLPTGKPKLYEFDTNMQLIDDKYLI